MLPQTTKESEQTINAREYEYLCVYTTVWINNFKDNDFWIQNKQWNSRSDEIKINNFRYRYLHSHVSCPTYYDWFRRQGNDFFQNLVNSFILIDGIKICHDFNQQQVKYKKLNLLSNTSTRSFDQWKKLKMKRICAWKCN